MMQVLAAAAILLASGTASAKPEKREVAEKASDSADKKICKRFIETGSLVKGYRVCKTKREWEQERDTIRANSSNINSCANMGTTGTC